MTPEYINDLTKLPWLAYPHNRYTEDFPGLLAAYEQSQTALVNPITVALDTKITDDPFVKCAYPNAWPKSSLNGALTKSIVDYMRDNVMDCDGPLSELAETVKHHPFWIYPPEHHSELNDYCNFENHRDLPQGEKYVYPIVASGDNIFYSDYYLKHGGNIPDRVISDAQKGLCKILISEHMEGYQVAIQNFVQKLSEINNIPMSAFGFVDGNFYTPAWMQEIGARGFYCNFFEQGMPCTEITWPHIERLEQGIVTPQPFNVVHFNRMGKLHRLMSIAGIELMEPDIEKNILRTLCDSGCLRDVSGLLPGTELPEKFQNPDAFLYDVDISVNCVINTDTQYHGYVNFVNETHYSSDSLFFTEKTMKVLAGGQPFILSSAAGSLEVLKAMGYKTFAPIIDETYDTLENPSERMLAMLQEVKRIASMSNKEARALAEQTTDICLHNHKTFIKNQESRVCFRKVLNDIREWINE